MSPPSSVPVGSCSSSNAELNRPDSKHKFSYFLHWSNVNVLGNPRESPCSSNLTKKSLQVHDRRHAFVAPTATYILNDFIHTTNTRSYSNYGVSTVDEKNAKCSPYYRGLVHTTLLVDRDREKNLNITLSNSPGRESHATTVATTSTSSSLSSIILKIQGWSSCFTIKSSTSARPRIPSSSSFSSNRSKENMKKAVTGPESKAVSGTFKPSDTTVASVLQNEQKPLRERALTSGDSRKQTPPPPSPPPPPPATNPPTSPARRQPPTSPTPPTPDVSPSKTSPLLVMDDDDKDATDEKVNERFSWANKYQPKTLKDFICNRDKVAQLHGHQRSAGGFSHYIFQGPPGVGKRTMICAMLAEAFGADRVQTREKPKTFELKGEAMGKLEVNVKESAQHVEINVSDLKGYEKHVIVELIRETQSSISNEDLRCSPADSGRAIILCEADKLSTDALLYIRWLLERYKGSNRFFFCCSDVSKLQPIKTLCAVVHLLPPSKQEIIEVLEFIATQEGIHLPRQLAEKMADNSKNNLRQAIRSFEASFLESYPFKEDQAILTGWEDDIANIAKNMVEEQSPKQLYVIRGKLKNLIEHDVSPEFIFKSLVGDLKKLLDEQLQLQIENLYEEYSNGDGFDSEEAFPFARSRLGPMRKNSQPFLRIEEFIAKFMSCYTNQCRKTNTGNANAMDHHRQGA